MQPRRQQQQSILSFPQKPPRDRAGAGEGTPPEKPPRPPAGSVAGIMERLVRPPPLSQGRNQNASHVGHLDGKTLPGRNQVPSNGRSSALFSGPCSGEYSGATMFPKQGSGFLKENLQGPAHGADTPLTEYGSVQTHLQQSAKKFSLVSANGEYTRAATTFVLNSNDIHTEEPSKKLCLESSVPLYIKAKNLFAELEANESPLKNNSKNSSFLMNDKHIGATAALFPEHDSSPLKPETPAMRGVIPRLKRVQEEQCVADNKQCFPLWVKKMKSAHCSPVEKKDHDEMADIVRSKFEWLNPSTIRDANRRRPDDPLYDKSTLFIPPDALRKMSTSQKQSGILSGKFYELYELDAEIGQKELDWKMTVNGVGKCRQVGMSENGIDDAVDKLVARGYKVGRIEQMESAIQAKARGSNSVIERKLLHVSTPSTAVDSNIGTDAVHLLALKEVTLSSSGSRVYGFAFLDYAALKIWVGSLHDDDSSAALGALLVQVSPREIIYETSGLSKETHKAIRKYASADCAWNQDAVICALGGLIGHLTRLMLHDALKNGEVLPYHVYKTCLRMDGQTLVNLEIFSNNFDGGSSGTLYKHLNHCVTASGKRLLRRWICHPLKDIDAINKRLDVVEAFIQNCGLGPTTLGYLRKIPDLERLLGQVRSTVGLSSSVRLPFIGERILKKRTKTFIMLINGLRNGLDLLNDLQRADHGVSALYKAVEIPTLSSLRELIHQFEEKVQNEFPHYQDLDVKDDDGATLAVLVEHFVGRASEWSLVINAVSTIDVLRSFAAMTLSSFGAMCRPHILLKDDVPILRMKGLWHPYAFAESANGLVPNDLTLGQDLSGLNRFELLLTGPNMGGKSTIMRATCLAIILAQLGCYVPCTSSELTLADSIFTRLGATDRIMSGESTFLVECTETASVLQNATEDSLVLLDELGRGTSTFDGYAIAYAVFRHLVERVRCHLLFATHYHSLTKEFASHPHVSLQHMACMLRPRSGAHDSNGEKELTFLYRLTSGACPESYGLQDGHLDEDVMDTLYCVSQELKAHFKKAR
ncbi:DNA mismatch repair protein MSH7 [Panicum miliaceum]|uniref:DNA mismatch repair protein MSH7 n=1 Tax=Panicum miliaceum TaxID=4540 RepID=A0A3L6SR81_PANMI|nr:DNA mismatch repair protein MSH7 [Panicum miliaceum]